MSRITTEEIFQNNASISQRLNTPQAAREIEQQHEKQRAQEMSIITNATGAVCPVQRLDTLQEQIVNLQPQEFKAILQSQFYNPEVMIAAMCVAGAIFYSNPAMVGNISDNQRIRNWLRRLRRIGAESVEGYAMVAGVENANDVFIVKAPRSTENDELQHELFVGMFGLNQLRAVVPNFAYVLGGFRCSPPMIDTDTKEVVAFCNNDRFNVNYVLYENITPAVTFREYVATCTPQQFLNKYLQILYALHVAWQTCQFTHYDLHDENVLVRDVSAAAKNLGAWSDRGFYIPYQTERGQEYILTDAVSTVIDFGIAHIKYNGQHYGVYNRLAWGVFPRRSFPMHDAYKLLLMSMRSMLQARNMATFNEAAKILRFFNQDESAIDIVNSQARTYYYLPLVESTEKLTHLDLTTYIRTVCQCDFIHASPRDGPLLHCQGSDVCLSTVGAFSDTGIAPTLPLVPTTLFEFYDVATKMVDENRITEYKNLAQRFDYPMARTDGLKEYNNLIIDLNRLVANLKVMPLRGAPIQTLMTYPMMSQYRQYMVQVADIFDTLQQIDLQATILRSVAQTYGDQETSQAVDANQIALMSSRVLLAEAIQSIDNDRKYLQQVMTRDNLPIIQQAVRNDDRLGWYWRGIRDFDYVVL